MSFLNDQEEAKSLIEEQGRLVKQFREEVVEEIKSESDKVKTFVSEKDERMSSRLDEIEERMNVLTRPDGSLKSEDSSIKEHKDLFVKYLQTPHRDWHGEKAERLKELQKMHIKAGDNILAGDLDDGGYLIPEQLESAILDNITEIDPILQEVQTLNVSGQSVKLNIGHDASADFYTETTGYASITQGMTGNFVQMEISNHELLGRAVASKEALEDLPNIENYIIGKMSTAMGQKLGESLVNGSGSGQPKGFNQASTGDSNTFLRPNQNDVNLTAGSALMDFDHFVTLVYEKTKTEYLRGAKFAFNRNTLSQIRKIKDENNQYLWNPAPALDNPGSILGFPYFICPTLASLGQTAGSYLPVYFGDFKQAYLFTRRLGMSVERLNEVAWPMVQFISRMRVGGQLIKGEALGRIAYTVA